MEDHIAPWKTTYLGARYLGAAAQGQVRFVLGGSGHIAGIVNPPAAKKYHYWTNDALPATPDEWFAAAKQNPGSWWEDWQKWIAERNAGEEKVPARQPGDGQLKVLEDAPGSYASLRIGTNTAVKSTSTADFK
jgi:polyhydroxyalkanoate synthase